MVKKVLMPLARGFEEIEALTPMDYLRRAGIELVSAGLEPSTGQNKGCLVTGSHNIPVMADTSLGELVGDQKLDPSFWDAIILPGGMPGASNLSASMEIRAFLLEMAAAGKWICAICASPALVLAPLGLLDRRNCCCFPGMEDRASLAKWSEARVTVDENPGAGGFITSRGAGTAGEFAIAIISRLLNEEEGRNLAKKVLLYLPA